MFKSGFVNIYGLPNSGKSSLFNYLVDEKLSIITHLPQTTRRNIQGIITDKDSQIVLCDTPGILSPKYKLQHSLKSEIEKSFKDYDLAVYIFNAESKDFSEDFIFIQEYLDISKTLFLFNKIDKIDSKKIKEQVTAICNIFPKQEIITLSVQDKSISRQEFLQEIKKYLPEHPPYFDSETLTNAPERFFVAEMVREQIFLHLKDEIPFKTTCVVESFKEREDIIIIHLAIIANSENHKMLLLGKNGSIIKLFSTKARKNIETFLQKKVYLDTKVKVRKNWVNNLMLLREYGYSFFLVGIIFCFL